ncbi:hypothetical protein BH10PSE14_BH10PSE14_21670 [soil metagenome]|uniref:hypothetical protein n=1 Tax=Parasphingomonas halimpatiens TaxID=3096162 RepID=UPI002FC93143
MTEPHRARAVFSTEDFALMKEALATLIAKVGEDDVRMSRISALYHRLGRVGG